jgi:hypothetical protein
MDGACSTHGRDENAYKVMFRKPEGKRPLAKPRRRWEDNIGMEHREVGWEGVVLMHLAEHRDQ